MLDSGCVFCAIIKGDIPAAKVYEDDAIAKSQGIYKGRKPIQRPEFEQVVLIWREGRITAVEAMKRLNMKPRTFYRKVKKVE